MTKTIQLAKPYTPKKLGNKVYLSEKLDGVPVRIDLLVGPYGDRVQLVTMRTRQDEFPASCEIVLSRLMRRLNAWFENKPEDVRGRWSNAVLTFVGEVTHEQYTDFKDISGVVRRQTPQDGLVLNLFDFNASFLSSEEGVFDKRDFLLHMLIPSDTREVRKVPQIPVSRDQIDTVFENFMKQHPRAEGMVVRDAAGKFEPGKRTWCYQKLLRKPTIDLHIVGFEEAVAEDGKLKGMVGRVIALYKGKEIGVGPGKLTHNERTALWNEYCAFHNSFRKAGRIATIQYKEDPSYEALREPTFQYWRYDKDTPDA